jgi:hypothetical protein
MVSRQLPTRPLPVALVPIDYCGRNRRFVMMYPYANTHLNDLTSHKAIDWGS